MRDRKNLVGRRDILKTSAAMLGGAWAAESKGAQGIRNLHPCRI